MDQPLFAERSTVSSVLELAALNKSDWEQALENILRIDSHTLRVERTSYWTLSDDPRSITCDLGYVSSADALERGALLLETDAPTYLQELERARVLSIDDVVADPRARDLREYTAARRISSMLDIPIWAEAKLVGVLCHEHVGAQRHWIATEIDFALAVAQAISTAVEARKRTQAEEQERRANFLAHATWELSQSLDEDVVARRALTIALPRLGDWGALDFFENGEVVRKAIAHSDPRKQLLLERYSAAFPPRPGSAHMTVQVHRLGESVVVPEVTEDGLRNNQFTEEHIRALRGIGVRSALAVPLEGSGFSAVLQLISTGRTYGYEALKLVEEYGLRVVAALTNARLYRRSQEALRTRDEFLMLASHELKTPLTALRISSEQMGTAARAAGPEIARPAERILRGSRRLTRLVDHMIDAVGTRHDLPVLKLEPTDLVPLVREVVDELAVIMRRAPVEVIAPTSLVGRWDGDRLQELVGNLVENALKFGGAASVRVTVAAEGDFAVLSVVDRGVGIDPRLVAGLFQPFDRGEADRGYGGLGLGLFLVRKIVDAHHGTIHVHSTPGTGSEFVVRLPGVVRDHGNS